MHLRVEGTTVSTNDLQPVDGFPVIPDYLRDLTSTPALDECSCTTDFGVGAGDCVDGNFCVNGEVFNPSRFVHTIELGEVIERDLIGVAAHPYHQHVYPFQIVENPVINDDEGGHKATFFQLGDWHDVIMIDGLRGGSLLTRYQPNVHLGRIMLHCHRLNHEDLGMMAQEDVLDPAEGGSCECDASHFRPTPTPSSSPSLRPSLRPTSVPSAAPSGRPSLRTTRSPSPSSSPIASPSASPSTTPQVACVDSTSWEGSRNGNTFTCNQINDNNRVRRCDVVGTDGLTGNQACPIACLQCTASPTVSPSSPPSPAPMDGGVCEDDDSWRGTTANSPTVERDCSFIQTSTNPTRLCQRMTPVAPDTRTALEACPDTCGQC